MPRERPHDLEKEKGISHPRATLSNFSTTFLVMNYGYLGGRNKGQREQEGRERKEGKKKEARKQKDEPGEFLVLRRPGSTECSS